MKLFSSLALCAIFSMPCAFGADAADLHVIEFDPAELSSSTIRAAQIKENRTSFEKAQEKSQQFPKWIIFHQDIYKIHENYNVWMEVAYHEKNEQQPSRTVFITFDRPYDSGLPKLFDFVPRHGLAISRDDIYREAVIVAKHALLNTAIFDTAMDPAKECVYPISLRCGSTMTTPARITSTTGENGFVYTFNYDAGIPEVYTFQVSKSNNENSLIYGIQAGKIQSKL